MVTADDGRSRSGSPVLAELADRFDVEWAEGKSPVLEAYLANLPEDSAHTLLRSVLSVCGPQATFRLFDDEDLDNPRHPANRVSGEGTAVCCHPDAPGVVVVGDTAGRIHLSRDLAGMSWPEDSMEGYLGSPRNPVRGLAFSANGSRLAAVTDQRVWVFAPHQVGLLWQDRLTSVPLDVRFDPSDSRLLVAARDGTVTIWEAGLDRLHVPAALAPLRTPLRWRETTLLESEEATGLALPHQPPAAFDERGRLGILYSRLEGPERVFRVGSWNKKRFEIGKEVTRMSDGPTAVSVAGRASTLFVREGKLVAAFRKPLPLEEGGNAGELVLFRADSGKSSPAGEMGNCWFSVHALSGQRGSLAFTHFSHEYHNLVLTQLDGAGWKTSILGRLGDGFNHLAAIDHQDTIHMTFSPLFNQVTHPLTYLRHSATRPTIREVVDDAIANSSAAFALGPGGEPAVLYRRIADGGHWEMVLSRRTEAGWRRTVVLDRFPGTRLHPIVEPLSLACDTAGQFHAVLAADGPDGGLFYLTGQHMHWQTQHLPGSFAAAFLLLDAQGSPVIVAKGMSGLKSSLRLLRVEN